MNWLKINGQPLEYFDIKIPILDDCVKAMDSDFIFIITGLFLHFDNT